MIEVEKFPCNDKREAEAREEYWRCHFNSQLNIRRAYITNVGKIDYKKQFYLDNKDNILKQKKQYYEANKQKKLEYQKTYYNNKKNKTDSSSDDSTESV